MRRTMKNFAKVVFEKERAAWRSLNYIEERYGKDSVERQKALSEWASMNSIRMMFESQDVFDNAYDTWCKK